MPTETEGFAGETGSTPGGSAEVKVGEVRALLAKSGVPHADDTHYGIAAARHGGHLVVLTCCDGVDEVVQLFTEAVGCLTGDGPLAAEISNRVIVRRDDLRTVLAESEGFIGGKDNEAFSRLAAAAGVQ